MGPDITPQIARELYVAPERLDAGSNPPST